MIPLKNLLITTVLLLPLVSPQVCTLGQYWTGGSCAECDATCDTCTSSSTASCSNCTAGYYSWSPSSCSFTCSSSFSYINFNTQTCSSCSSSCLYCIEAGSNCNNCYSGTYYRPDSGLCNSTCTSSIGYYASSSERRCVPCRDKNCLSCNSNGDCNTCRSFYQVNTTTGRCVRKCPSGM